MAKILEEIIAWVHRRSPDRVLVFDYGCGDARYWKPILEAVPNIELIGYDPDRSAIERAWKFLKGFRCQFYTGDPMHELNFRADFIVSLSVLERVYDREAYLRHAKRLLAPDGTFYLNYDDGHFRLRLDLGQPNTWPLVLREYVHNLLAPLLARTGFTSRFQARVSRGLIDQLVLRVGFKVERAFYSNLECFKGLAKYIPEEKREAFLRLWMSVEDRLNEEFLHEGDEFYGDRVNLWRFMGSRTLVLRHG